MAGLASNGGIRRSRDARSARVGKPRCDSTLDRLTRDRKERLEVWLLDENRGYREVSELVAREWGVRTSHSAVGRYYMQRLVPRQLLEAEEAAVVVMSAVGGPPSPRLRRGDDSFGEAARQRAQQLGFMALMGPKPDGRAARVYLGIVDRIERRELARERIELSERLVKLRERNEMPPPKPKRTHEEKVEEMCGIFGVGTEVYYENERRQAEALAEAARRAQAAREARAEVASDAQQGCSETPPLQVGGETGVGTAAGCRSHGCGRAAGESDRAEARARAEDQTEPVAAASAEEITIKSTCGEAGKGPGAPGSFHVGTAGHAVFSSRDGGEAARSRSGELGTQNGQTGNAELGTRTAGAEEITSASGSGEGMMGTGGGTAAGCRSHDNVRTEAVSFGRVLRAENELHAISGPAGLAVSPGAGTAGFGDPALHRTESVRGVANWQMGGVGVPGAFHGGAAGHAVVFGGYGPGRNGEHANYWPRPVW